MAIFRFFKMAAAAILNFRNFKFLTVATTKRVEMRYSAKFRRTAADIWRCFKMAAAVVVDLENFTFLTVGTVKSAELRHSHNHNHNMKLV